jgi:hypothetical protein
MDHFDDTTPQNLGFWEQHRFILLIAITMITSFFLVVISMALYASSGAAQLDLSRPGYKSVTSQAIDSSASFENYPATGKLDSTAIKDFKTLYDSQAANAKAVDAFSGDPLSPDVLGISAPQNQQ